MCGTSILALSRQPNSWGYRCIARVCTVGHQRERILISDLLCADQTALKGSAKPAMPKSSDPWSIVVIVLTVALFILALFVKGFTKGLLVECGVLMVSIKL